jgi:hypothetical protein
VRPARQDCPNLFDGLPYPFGMRTRAPFGLWGHERALFSAESPTSEESDLTQATV